MHISYTASEDDFVRAGMLMLRKKSGGMRALAWIGGCILLYVLVTLLTTAQRGEQLVWQQEMIKAVPALVFGVFIFSIPFFTRGAFRKQFRSMPILSETRTLQADFSGLHFRSASTTSDQLWFVYEAFCEDKHSFLLIQQGNRLFFPIPKRQLSEEQIEEVRSVFETYLPRRG